MKLLKRLNPFARKEVEEITTPFGKVIGTSIGNGYTGPADKLAMESAVFVSCLRVLTNSISVLPFKLYKVSDKSRTDQHDHAIWKVINGRPNPFQSAAAFKAQMLAHMLVYGNYYGLIVRVGNVIKEIIPMPPPYVTVKQNRLFELTYHYNNPTLGIKKEYAASEVLHVPGLVFTGLLGEAISKLGQQILQMDIAMQDHAKQMFLNNAMPGSVVLKSPENLEKAEADEISESFEQRYGGNNKFRTLFVYGGMEVTTLNQSAVDTELINQEKEAAVKICGLLGVPPHKIGILDRATFSNIEHQAIEYVTDGLLPYLVRIEEETNYKALGLDSGYYCKFNVDALLRGDSKSRAEVLEIKRRNGVINANEWRALDDLPPCEGGDMHLQPVNYTKLGTVLPVKELTAPDKDK